MPNEVIHQMPRSYEIFNCPVARTLDLIGERWTLLMLRDLLQIGPRRFQDFQDSFPRLPPTTLSVRLKEMEETGLISTRPYSVHPPRVEYLLTPKGRSLGPIVRSLRDWGMAHP